MIPPDVLEAAQNALIALGPLPPSSNELANVLTVAKFETDWGRAGQFAGTNNWGATHCGKSQPDSECFAGKDYHRDGAEYHTRFERFDTMQAGAEAYIKRLRVYVPRSVITGSSIEAVSHSMATYRKSGYYEAPESTYTARLIPIYAEVRKGIMATDEVKGYLQRLDNEWSSVHKNAADAFAKAVSKNTSLPWSFADFRADHLSWSAWYAPVKDAYFLGDSVYSGGVDWDKKLKAWEAKMGADAGNTAPHAPIPDKPPTLTDTASHIGDSVSGALIAGVACIAGLYFLTSRR
jgi:hypothetical protein